MYVKSHIQTLINFLGDPNRWTKHHWAKDSNGREVFNVYTGVKFDIIGAICYLFDNKVAAAVKRYLESYLYINANKYLHADVFNPPKHKGPRFDWGNLAKFNDESEHAFIMLFLSDAMNEAVSSDTMQLLAR